MEDIPKIVSYDIVLQYMMTCLPEIFAILSFVVLVLVYFYAPYWRVRRLPGPPTTPFLGHLPLLQKYGPDVFRTLAKTYGPIYRFHMGRQPLIIIADPDLCRVVGIQKFKAVSNRSLPSPISASPLHQKGLFYTRDSQWSLMRNTILSLYQPSHLSNLIPVFQTYINSASLTITEHEDIDFSNFTLKLATDIIGHAAFGVDFGLSKFIRSSLSSPTDNDNEEEKEVSQFVNQHIHSTASLKMDLSGSFSIKVGLFFPILQRLVGFFLQFIPGTAEWKVRKNTRNLTDRLNAIVQRRSKQENRTSGDFLSLILNESEAGRGRKGRISEEYVNALTYEHLLAGSTTTSFTVTSIVYLVSGHEDVEKRLLEEIDRFPKSGSPPTSEDLDSQFPYLDQVIKESMRFYTVSPLVARETSQEIEVGGYILPKGTWVWLALGVLAKDARNFPNPDEFRPERFDPSCEEEKKRHPYAHIPFGIGPRSCLGKRFALQEIKLTLIHLYQSYIFRHAEDMVKPPALDYGVVLNFKNGIKLKAIKRSF